MMEEGCGGGSADGNTRCLLAPALGRKDLEGEYWHLHSNTGGRAQPEGGEDREMVKRG